jgi:hypothetical protein
MIVVKIELWPHGKKEEARDLGVLTISNDGTGTDDVCAYDVLVAHGGKYWGKPGAWKRGRIEKFRRVLSPYHLVARALAACGIR